MLPNVHHALVYLIVDGGAVGHNINSLNLFHIYFELDFTQIDIAVSNGEFLLKRCVTHKRYFQLVCSLIDFQCEMPFGVGYAAVHKRVSGLGVYGNGGKLNGMSAA